MISFESLIKREEKIAVVGLGYVGLPLAVHLSKPFDVVGYDLKAGRIEELTAGRDRTYEVSESELAEADILFSNNAEVLASCKLIIVAVPTPIDQYRIPDLTPLKSAASIVGKHMPRGACVVYESTVYPGATEEVCVPIMEMESQMTMGSDFFVGYSPERINPGDKVHTLDKIVKIVSGCDRNTLELLDKIYGKIVQAGIHKASSIKVAEAAKVIENTQRDLNIALMNELAMIFEKMGIDTLEVLEAAGTKWNFLPFTPGLVGGHCIGVDPYYLTFRAEAMGYHPEMILAGRRINDGMGKYIAERAVKMLIRAGKKVDGARVAMLGITFKENVPDLRNTRVVDIIHELADYGIDVRVHDPLADAREARGYLGISLREYSAMADVDAVIVAVTHRFYIERGLDAIAELCREGIPVILDVKGAFSREKFSCKDIFYWRL